MNTLLQFQFHTAFRFSDYNLLCRNQGAMLWTFGGMFPGYNKINNTKHLSGFLLRDHNLCTIYS